MILQHIINHLDVPDDDYWYDSGACFVRNLIDENSEMILNQILIEWREWPEQRQEHLAYILGEGVSETEKTLVNALLTSKYESVVYRAKESLNTINQKT